jgi:hypothetical protein
MGNSACFSYNGTQPVRIEYNFIQVFNSGLCGGSGKNCCEAGDPGPPCNAGNCNGALVPAPDASNDYDTVSRAACP